MMWLPSKRGQVDTIRRLAAWIPLLLVTVACRAEPARPEAVDPWADATLSDSGFGPVVVGMTPMEAKAASGDRLRLPERLGAECDYAVAPGIDGLMFMIEHARVVRVEVRARGVRTAEGAGVGDTEARVQELYPGRVTVSPHKYTDGHYLTVAPRDAAGGSVQLIFETDGHVVTQFRGGLLPQVAYVEGCG